MVKNKGKKNAKKVKDRGPEYVSNTMKQMYINEIQAIHRKIERRRQWAQQWTTEIPLIKMEMENYKDKQDETIKEIKLKIKEAKALKMEKRELVKNLSKEMDDNLLEYKLKISDIEKSKLQAESTYSSEIIVLEQKVKEINTFMATRTELAAKLEEREHQMIILEERYEDKLEEIRDEQKSRCEIIKKEIKQKLQEFEEKFRKDAILIGEDFDLNQKLREDLKYLSEEIEYMNAKIPIFLGDIKTIKEDKKRLYDYFQDILKSRKMVAEESYTIFETEPEISLDNSGISEEVEKFIPIGEEEQKLSEPLANNSTPNKESQHRAILKAARKILAESQVLHVVPKGALPEESKKSDEEKSIRYAKSLDVILQRQEDILQFFLQILAHRKLQDDEDPATTDAFGVREPFSESCAYQDEIEYESAAEAELSFSRSSSSNNSSLPRSLSPPTPPKGESDVSDADLDDLYGSTQTITLKNDLYSDSVINWEYDA